MSSRDACAALDHLKLLEERLLSTAFRKDSAAVAALLTDDFEEVGASGRVFDKAAILRDLQEEVPSRLTLRDFRAHPLSPEIVFVTYISTREEPANNLSARRTSIWVRQEDAWRLRFHQGTRIP